MALLFNYNFQPQQVFIGAAADISLVIENPLTSGTVEFDGGRDGSEIHITFPVGSGKNDLVNALGFKAVSQTDGFSCDQSSTGQYYVVTSQNDIDITPGMQIIIKFEGMIINGQEGTAQVGIDEYVLIDQTASGTTAVTKVPQGLNVIAWLEPLVVGLYGTSTLYWRSTGGTTVQVAGLNEGTGVKQFPVKGEPPYPGSYGVNILPEQPQRVFTVTVFAGTTRGPEVMPTLTQNPPLITSYTGNKSGTIGVTDTVQLKWSCLYASSTSLKPPGTAIPNPLSPRTVVPGQDLVNMYVGNYGAMPDTATYRLTAFGYQNNPSQSLSFKLAPVGLAYFKYKTKGADGKLSDIVWATDPAQWKAVELNLNNNLNTLTIYQPGGRSNVYYLGSGDTTHPQIQYFNAEKGTGDQYTFSWVTANLKSLVLNPGNFPITGGDIQNGNKTMILTAAQYILSGVGNNGESIQSVLNVPYTNVASKVLSTAEVSTDPDCNATITEAAGISSYYDPSAAHKKDAAAAIAKLQFEDIWRLPPFKITQGTVRLEVLGAIAGGGRHWQLQVNGLQGKSAIAAVTIQGNLATASTPARKAYVERMVRHALSASLDAQKIHDVDGSAI